jgi:iron complex transport system substrate-binding protein
MSDDERTTDAPTRRDYLTYGGTIVGAGLLAGCTGTSASGSGPDSTGTGTSSAEPTETNTASPPGTATATETETSTDDGSYAVEMFPVGEVEFESVPGTVTTYNMGWADMVVSLGQVDKLQTNRLPAPTLFYDRFDIEYDNDYAPLLGEGYSWSKETFYERDSDVFLIDPNLVENWDDDWDEADTQEIARNVGPFFGCHNRRMTSEWQRELGYPEQAPSMLEAFDRVGTVLDERDRTEAWLDLHEELQSTVQSRLPSDSDLPSVALINSGSAPEKGTFYAMNLGGEGYEMKPYRDLGLVEADAFAGVETGKWGETDYETMLEVDPDLVLVHWGITTGSVTFGGDGAYDAAQFHEQFVAPMEDDEVGSQLTAVQNGRVLPGPTAEQGPLVNAFQTELTARLFYPDEFGELDLDAPLDVPEEEQLFDRQRVADIIDGEV